MRALHSAHKSLPIENENALVDVDLPTPQPSRPRPFSPVQAVSVIWSTPQLRMRTGAGARAVESAWMGRSRYRASDRPELILFKAGDAVFYAGAIGRQGTNSEFHLVDERIVGRNLTRSIGQKLRHCRSRRSPLGKCCLIGLIP